MSILDSVAQPAEQAVAPRWWRRPGRVALALGAFAVVAVGSFAIQRDARISEADFAAYSHQLGSLSAPVGSFTPYDPTVDGTYGPVQSGSWNYLADDIWSSTERPEWWVSVRGWTTTVASDQGPASCRAVLDWLSASGTTLGLSAPGENETLATCLTIFDEVRTVPATTNISDAWGGRGGQTTDGQPRLRTGVEMSNGTEPGQVVIRVEADATVAHR
jgi:hypothetical protein